VKKAVTKAELKPKSGGNEIPRVVGSTYAPVYRQGCTFSYVNTFRVDTLFVVHRLVGSHRVVI